ncbi:biopolymer transporter ExbD [Calidifontimicrobium sp. SYSU G02091]|jgi:biopolymer transport protein ExbD|uniref:ExbD/TolR family protein n=1 Tax=Calidifontimicrobium sp. SYSU G02091 TaxID=2926421 RepID=UPI001F535992|nr:biopolymer transporter ExbD [Calidifontimicrobium sp. SYSU G02091]MCI1190350.1 biopolymer transporter ExbD [Calidifontimicrobium sp. SYSU G02091]
MAFASFDGRRGAQPTAEINMVPLIDVMLVLLVIFIVTAPLLTHAVKLDLPRASSAANEPPPQRIEFAIDATGQRFWNGEPVSRDAAAARLAAEGRREPKPELQLRADHRVPYGDVAQTLADAAAAGLTRIGFVSEPEGR